MFDISKLPKPDLINEYTLDEKVAALKQEVMDALAEAEISWVGSDADPMIKVLKAVAQLDCLREQRINDTARRLLLAFARGNDLDNIRPDIQRLQGGNATCDIKLTIRTGTSGVIPAGTEFRDSATGELKAKTFQDYEVSEGTEDITVKVQIYDPAGAAGNGISGKFDTLLIASAMVADNGVTQDSEGTGGTDPESDERYIQRILLAPTANMGGRRSYEYLVLSADANIKDAKILYKAPGELEIYLLSSEGDGIAPATMIANVENALDGEILRPQSDDVKVYAAGIVKYSVIIDAHLWPYVSRSVYKTIKDKAEEAVKSLHYIGKDVTKYVLWGLSAVEGVAHVDITIKDANGTEVTEINVNDKQAAYCTGIVVNENAPWDNSN